MIRVVTDYPVAEASPDHQHPCGTKNDNNTNLLFIDSVEKFFRNKMIKVLDLGCAGGQLAVDFYERGHLAVGLEGSDYSRLHSRANWPQYDGKVLFTCDLTKDYSIFQTTTGQDVRQCFDLITAWELVEHIAPDDLDAFFGGIKRHLLPNGLLCGSVSQISSPFEGVELHQSVFPESEWVDHIFPKYFPESEFEFMPYPFTGSVNGEYVEQGFSFLFCIRRRSEPTVG